MNEYIDLKNIILKLQDVDNLKKIILNDFQRIFFDLIPKPDLLQRVKKSVKSYRNMITNEEILKNYHAMLEKKHEFNDRIISLLDEESLIALNLPSPNRNIYLPNFCI